MVLSIGVDTVSIARFATWHLKQDAQLLRLFSHDEITYCRGHALLSAERFAARFAAREALWKAVSSYAPDHGIPFLTFCRATPVVTTASGAPSFAVDWSAIQPHMPYQKKVTLFLSLSHSEQIATAFVIITKEHAP